MMLEISKCTRFALLCFTICFPQAYSVPIEPAKIVIVGAGASGIGAAVKLLEYGFQDVIILEAEQRIGGRIHTIPFADNVVDLGAQWCHGEKNNVVYEMVNERNMLGSSKDIHKNLTMVRTRNSEKVPQAAIEALSEIFEEIAIKRENESIPFNISAHVFMKEELEKALKKPEHAHIDQTIAEEFLRYKESEESGLEAADDLTIIPAHAGEGYENCEGDNLLTWKDKGYRAFLNVLMQTEELGREYGLLQDRIRLSKKVQKLKWNRTDGKVLISCEDGEEILADHVIVTVSLGVLKANQATMFEPPLSDKKKKAINEINFGTVGKVFLEFDKQFWPKNWTGVGAFWSEEDLQNIRGTQTFWWEGVPVFIGVDYQPRVLEVWFNGRSARHMETMVEKDVRNSLLEVLDRLVEYDLTDVVNVTRTSWYMNPNFRGTYSFHSIQTLESGVSTKDLEEPIILPVNENKIGQNNKKKPLIQFAGEATSLHHYSTVHGAFESGWREAHRLKEFYSL